MDRKGFTLVELLIVIAIIVVLGAIVVLVINPVELLRQSRDSSRIADMGTLDLAIAQFAALNHGGSLGQASTTYVSVPDPVATSTAGDQCQGLGLPALPIGWVYHCAASSTYRKTDGTGWIPVDFATMSSGSPFGTLPVDPTNATSSGLYYTYAVSGSQYELTSVFESSKYGLNGSADKVSTDGGILPDTYEVGTDLALMTADRGQDVVGEWLLDAGTGSTAYDSSIYEDDGTLINAPTWTTGMFGDALTFNGTNQRVDTNAYVHGITNVTTATFWLKTTGASHYQTWELGYNVSCVVGWQSHIVACSPDGGTTEAVSTIHVDDGNWHFVAYVVDDTTQSLYVDDVLQATTTVTPDIPTSWVSFGGDRSGTTYFPGSIDDVRVYDQALGISAIQQIYKAGGGT